MGKIQNTHKVQEGIKNLSRKVSINEMEVVIILPSQTLLKNPDC